MAENTDVVVGLPSNDVIRNTLEGAFKKATDPMLSDDERSKNSEIVFTAAADLLLATDAGFWDIQPQRILAINLEGGESGKIPAHAHLIPSFKPTGKLPGVLSLVISQDNTRNFSHLNLMLNLGPEGHELVHASCSLNNNSPVTLNDLYTSLLAFAEASMYRDKRQK